MSGPVFNTIPGSGLIAPLFAFEVTSGGQYDSVSRLVLLGHKTNAGSLADATPAVVSSLEEATQLAGAGSMLREMYRIARANAATQEIWIVPVAASGVAGTWTLTVGTPPAAGGVGVVEIAGEPVQVAIGAGDNAATVAAAIRDAVNNYFNALTGAQLPVTAAASTNVCTLTARHAGASFLDLDVTVPTTVAGNAFVGVVTAAAGTTPSGGPDLTNALAALGDDPADFIVNPFSDTTNLGRAETALNDTSGRWSYARQSYGHAFSPVYGTTSEMTTIGLARNNRHETLISRYAGTPEPAWLWAAAIAARVAPWLSDTATGNVSRNQTGLVVEGLKPPRTRSTWPQYTTRNALLSAGVSTWSVTADGKVAVDKLITTYRSNALGQPDTTFRDVQALAQLMVALRLFRADLSTEHGQKSLADSNPNGLGAISTVADIKATLVHTYQKLVDRGVLEDVEGFTRDAIVQRDSVNTNRVNVLAPLDRVNALDVLAANARLYSQFAA
jgi:phage tail sheath gpL-like